MRKNGVGSLGENVIVIPEFFEILDVCSKAWGELESGGIIESLLGFFKVVELLRDWGNTADDTISVLASLEPVELVDELGGEALVIVVAFGCLGKR